MSAEEKITQYLIEHDKTLDLMSIFEVSGRYVMLATEGEQVVVLGQTYAIKDLLKAHNFSWDGTCWSKTARWHVVRDELDAQPIQLSEQKAAQFGAGLALEYCRVIRDTFAHDASRCADAAYNGFFCDLLSGTAAPRELKDYFLWRSFGTTGMPNDDKVAQAWTYVK